MDLPSSFRNDVLENAALRTFEAGDTIHFEGDEPGGIYGLVFGIIRVDAATPDHGPYFSHLLRPVTWFGEGAAITGLPRMLTMSATREAALLYVTAQSVQEIATRESSYWKFFTMPLLGLPPAAAAWR